MPRSWFINKKPILTLITETVQNNTLDNIEILDLGIGYGDFGRLIKQRGLKVFITGVEIWKNYKNNKWNYYDEIVIGDISKYLKKNKNKFDIILLIDVLEHFSHSDGIKILKKAKNITKKILIVSTPISKFAQGSRYGNPYETHRYIWSKEELSKNDFKLIFTSWIFLLTTWPPLAKLGVFIYKK